MGRERGSATLELVIVIPAMLLMIAAALAANVVLGYFLEIRARRELATQRRRTLDLQEQVWTRTWRRAGLGERLRLKYREFL